MADLDHRTSKPALAIIGHQKVEYADVGNMTHGLCDNTKDLIDIWMMKPVRRHEFGRRELNDIREAAFGLLVLAMILETKAQSNVR